MNDVAATSDRVFGMMLNQRSRAVHQKLKQMIDTGELGEIKRSVYIITSWFRAQSYYDSGGWRATWRVRGAVCWRINVRTIWICGSGSAACRSGYAPSARSANTTTSR